MRTYTLHLSPETKLNVVEAAGVKPACETCRHFNPKREMPVGECRCSSPRHSFNYIPHRYWPIVANDDWCGAHEAKAEVK